MDFSQEALRAPFATAPFIILVIPVPILTFLSQFLHSKTFPLQSQSCLSVRFIIHASLDQ